ncbi:DUF2865 domain-containing protein [Beijerinckia indica]|uniref:DUF2865 domain-containing protein n=1 Tax=Beijerinckia indica subsp. indica (strain ATCC 9039 / DSM 1715 / NCIMB 8712) TaxID=395963 RepID=B2IGY1_BEII9|nr:DUF2865 domain-containing protein [Beijerinckia indica]ACB97227.1 hypothetical protein Bind_3675 [Beijerinckia indica subsp. indica ATCC 9039]
MSPLLPGQMADGRPAEAHERFAMHRCLPALFRLDSKAVCQRGTKIMRLRKAGLIAYGLVLTASLTIGSTPSAAQPVDCNRLQAQIAASDSHRAQNPYAAALQKQRSEYDHLTHSARSLGCDRQQFAFFGAPQPPQCPGINARLEQLQASMSQMQAAASQAPENSAKANLVQAYNYYCRGGQPRERGFFETLFGINPEPPPPVPQAPVEAQRPQIEEQTGPKRGAQAVCVRTCDGGFFPTNLSLRHDDDGEGLLEVCQALCPNVEVGVYTRSPSKDISTAVALDGTPYTDLPNASKYQKTFDPACTCKPPGKSWAETLADADRVIGREHRGDILVTPEKSEELSQPKMAQPKGDPRQKAAAQSARTPSSITEDDPSVQEAITGAHVPTAGTDSAGIGAKDLAKTQSYGQNQGATEEAAGPDGVKRHVRIVGPLL